MRTTLGLALLLALVLLANAVPPGSGNRDEGSDDGSDDDSDGDTSDPPQNNAATVLTPTIYKACDNSVCWSALALTGVAWVMYEA